MCSESLRALYCKDYDSLRRLFAAGEDINATDEDGRTYLMHAVLAENAAPEMIHFLIESGADPNRQDRGQRWSALHFAARDQRSDLVAALIAAGAQVDCLDIFGNTPLWRAVMNQDPNKEVILALLAAGADPLLKNKHGVSPLDTARNIGNDALVTKLLEHSQP